MSGHNSDAKNSEISRRQFLKTTAGMALGVGLGGVLPQLLSIGDGVFAIPASGGYLLIDTKKCGGCVSCMLACSLVHEGRENLSLSRIQVLQNPFGRYPDDISQEQCRQCIHPACVEACPTGALYADKANNIVRLVEPKKCIGCQQCVEACPQTPSRVSWNYEDKCSTKCDLCLNTPYWEESGGPNGKQACIEVCPMNAIKFTREIPVQDRTGYEVNLRNHSWSKLGLPTG